MPKSKKLAPTRDGNLKEIEKYLDDRKIKHERVLGYVCFKYKGKDYHTTELIKAKEYTGVNIYI